ncbi:MAG: hypothetical protein AB1801_28305 [Chloroflexota bacterium]
MPVSKKRKKKSFSPPPPPKSGAVAVPKKKKLTTQQILIYVISGLMILSLAIGFLVGNTRRSQAVPTAAPQSTILLETPAPAESTPAPATVEPTTEN